MTTAAIAVDPPPANEPVRAYLPGSPERTQLAAALKAMSAERVEIPAVVGGERIRSGKLGRAVMPHAHQHVLADVHLADASIALRAVEAARAAHAGWAAMPWEARAAVFLRAAELGSGPWRNRLLAATMLGQSKTCHQAEIDAA